MSKKRNNLIKISIISSASVLFLMLIVILYLQLSPQVSLSPFTGGQMHKIQAPGGANCNTKAIQTLDRTTLKEYTNTVELGESGPVPTSQVITRIYTYERKPRQDDCQIIESNNNYVSDPTIINTQILLSPPSQWCADNGYNIIISDLECAKNRQVPGATNPQTGLTSGIDKDYQSVTWTFNTFLGGFVLESSYSEYQAWSEVYCACDDPAR